MVDNKNKFAKECGLSRQTISKFFNKKLKNPKLSTLTKISKALDCSVEDLLKKEEHCQLSGHALHAQCKKN